MGSAAREQGACPNNRMAAAAVVEGVKIEQHAVLSSEAQKKVDEKDTKRKIEAAKAAGYTFLENGTVVYTPIGKGNGASKGFKA